MKPERFKELLPFISAYAEGKTIQHRPASNKDWPWVDGVDLNFNTEYVEYRIKPTPTLRPWRPEEVPVGALVRNKQRDSEYNRYVIIAVNGDYVAAGRGMYEHLNILFNNSEHSLDHGKTWLPCGVMSE